MSTDKELLEWAAKAAGYDIRPHLNNKTSPELIFVVGSQNWNPLEDDGDALRLAVKLRLCVAIEFDRGEAITQHDLATEYFYDNPPTDQYAATRRAIVRAAAAIGKEMP